MRGKHTNDERRKSILLPFGSKTLLILLLLIFQNLFANFTIIDSLVTESGGENLVISDSTTLSKNNRSQAVIYISSGVEITSIDAIKNYEVAESSSPKIKKTERKKQSVLQIAKLQIEKKLEQKLASKKDNPVDNKHSFSTSPSGTHFSFGINFSKTFFTVSQSHVKQIFISESYKPSLVFVASNLVSVDFKTTEILTAQNKTSFSVRPPPFLL